MTPVYVTDLEQGSGRWIEARLGRPTASQFKRIVTPTGKPSRSVDGYLAELLAEWCTGEAWTDVETEWTERGKVLEPEARLYYEFHVDAKEPILECGIVYRDETRMVGGSPDALVGDHGLIEIKCPRAPKHIAWSAMDGCPAEHLLQCQGLLWITGRDWIDFMSYYPELPPFVARVEPDATIFAALDEALPAFVDRLLAGRQRLIERGFMDGETA